jgi:hypothetical protein
LHYRRRKGNPTYLLPLGNELSHIQEVTESLDEQVAKISGTTAASGQHIPGEVDNLEKLAEMVDSRDKATNDTNQKIAQLADKTKRLRNNPGATLAVTRVLQDAFKERYDQLIRSRSAEAQRRARTLQWLFDENWLLGEANEAIAQYMSHGEDGAYNHLTNIADTVHFAVQPFNLFEAETGHLGGRQPDDVTPLEHLQQGIDLIRDKSYLLTPLRWLTSSSLDDIADLRHDLRESTIQALRRRMAHLEEMRLTDEYHQLRGKLLPLFEVTIAGLEQRTADATKTAAKHAATLLIYQCMPQSGDPLQEAFYGRRGRLAKSA